MSDLARCVRINRACLRLKTREIAERVGCSIAFVSDVEHGRRNPSPRYAEKWADALEVSEEYFRYLLGRWPEDVAGLDEVQFEHAMRAFREEAEKW